MNDEGARGLDHCINEICSDRPPLVTTSRSCAVKIEIQLYCCTGQGTQMWQRDRSFISHNAVSTAAIAKLAVMKTHIHEVNCYKSVYTYNNKMGQT